MENNNNESQDIDDKKATLKGGIPSTEKISKMSTCKYTPISKNVDADLSVVDQWCEIRTKSLPARRSFHCSWNIKDFIYLFGGINLNKGKNAEFYKINLAQQTPTWYRFKPKGAECIEPLAYSAYASYEDNFYIICGQNEILQQVNTIYKITPSIQNADGENNPNSRNQSNPEPNKEDETIHTEDLIEKLEIENCPYLESHCIGVIKEGMLFFGGFSKGHYQNQLYFFDVKNNTITVKHNGEKYAPCPRLSAACAVYHDNFYLYGGQDQEGRYLKDFWVFSISKGTWEEVLNQENDAWPCGRSGHSMNLYNNEIYIFGGKTNNVMEVNELWKFSPESKSFELLQESLIEQYYTDDLNPGSEERYKSKKGQTSFKAGRSMNIKMLSENNLKKKKTNIQAFNPEFDQSMYSCFPPLSLMTSSLIYGMDIENSQWRRMMATLTMKSNQNNYVSIMGNVPTPRDGHTSLIYKDYMVIFGGDRNKFPMNDLYTFIF